MKAIGSETSVSSYRTPVPSKEYIAMMKEVRMCIFHANLTAQIVHTRTYVRICACSVVTYVCLIGSSQP